MRKIERIGEKKVMLDTSNDEMLYDSKTARAYHGGNSPTRGLDLYVHVCKDETLVFYLYHWTQWQGERSYIEPMSKDQAAVFAEENLEDIEEERATELGLIDAGAIE
jgi:hypothetical protein